MNRYGILGAYLPEFERVVGQMQFDLFHIYTVDAHTLQVVRNMRRFRYKISSKSFRLPHTSTIVCRKSNCSTLPAFSMILPKAKAVIIQSWVLKSPAPFALATSWALGIPI